MCQLITPGGLQGMETMESWKQCNPLFQFNYWISRELETMVIDIGWCNHAFKVSEQLLFQFNYLAQNLARI